ncbi:MAG: membrane protein insertase YidC [bacterium]|nr:membrane protein insertase YidC [bacterium]
MDKKSIIGIVLIFLILILWQSILMRYAPKKVEPKKEVPQQVEVAPPIESKNAPTIVGTHHGVSLPLDTIDTQLFRVIFTSLGASIQSIKLKQYKAIEGGWVELIPTGKRTLNDVVIIDNKEIDLSNEIFNVVERSPNRIVYEFVLTSGDTIHKVYEFQDSSYMFDISLDISNSDKYKIIWNSGLASTEKNKDMELRYFGGLATLGGITVVKSLSSLDTVPKGEPGDIDWVGVKNKYFLAAIIPRIETDSYSMKRFALGSVGGGCAYGCMPSTKDPEATRVKLALVTKSNKSYNFKVYTGPLDYDILSSSGFGLQNACYLGWKWITPISRLFLKIFLVLHRVIPNYGVVIIVFSFILTIVFFPLSKISQKSAIAMQQLQPKLQELQKKYKDDPKKLNQAMMSLYRKRGVSPLSGCLPLIIQIPIFFALYAILDTTIALRGAMFIPHWIEDLSQHDPYFALPILMGIMMFVQQKVQGFGVMGGQQASQQKMMSYFMPIMFTFIFLRFPAGLVLYWFTYNIFSFIQTYIVKGQMGLPAQEVK